VTKLANKYIHRDDTDFEGLLSASRGDHAISVGRMVIMSDENDDDGDDRELGEGVITQTDVKPKRPQLYKVLMLNDDYTPMEFVVHVLQRYFRMTMEEATQVMLHVHQKGVGVCGIFPFDVAETKVNQVMDLAKKHQHPLQCTLEKE